MDRERWDEIKALKVVPEVEENSTSFNRSKRRAQGRTNKRLFKNKSPHAFRSKPPQEEVEDNASKGI